MVKYTRLPQFEHVERQRAAVPPSGDPHDHRGSTKNSAIRSITISNETREDGSIVRRKETLFTNGKTMVEEKTLSRSLQDPSGVRYLPITPPTPPPIRLTTSSSSSSSPTTDNILPLFHRYPRPLTTKVSSGEPDRQGLVCRLAAGLVAILVLFQGLLWYMILSGQSSTIPAFLRSFQSTKN